MSENTIGAPKRYTNGVSIQSSTKVRETHAVGGGGNLFPRAFPAHLLRAVGGGGYSWIILGGGVPPGSSNPDPISGQKM